MNMRGDLLPGFAPALSLQVSRHALRFFLLQFFAAYVLQAFNVSGDSA